MRGVALGCLLAAAAGCVSVTSSATLSDLTSVRRPAEGPIEINVRVVQSTFSDDARDTTTSNMEDERTSPVLEEMLEETRAFRVRRDRKTAQYGLLVLEKSELVREDALFLKTLLSGYSLGLLAVPEWRTTILDVELIDLATNRVVAEHSVREETAEFRSLIALPVGLFYWDSDNEARRTSYRDIVSWAAGELARLTAAGAARPRQAAVGR